MAHSLTPAYLGGSLSNIESWGAYSLTCVLETALEILASHVTVAGVSHEPCFCFSQGATGGDRGK